MLCVRARLHSLRKNSCLCQSTASQLAEKLVLVSEHGFTACGKTHALCQSTASQLAEKPVLSYHGYDFSRAVNEYG